MIPASYVKAAYRTMLRALDYGCVYYWYHDLQVGIPAHYHLTRYMFPITPTELHEGFIIGEERIVTNRSGLFGWNDASEREVHVFDDEGREVERKLASRYAKLIERDGKPSPNCVFRRGGARRSFGGDDDLR